MQEKALKVLLTLAMLAVLCCNVRQTGTPLDVFIHANWAHLAVNTIAMWRMRFGWKVALPATIIGSAFISTSNAVGFSAVLFAAIGLQWHVYDCKASRWSMAVFLLISALVPGIAFLAHALPFFFGMGCDKVSLVIKKYRHDTK